MDQSENNRIIWMTFLLWGAWALISYSLSNAIDHPFRTLKRILPLLPGFAVIITANVRLLLPKCHLQKKQLMFFIGGILVVAAVSLFMYHDIFPWSEWIDKQAPHRHGNNIYKNANRGIEMRQIIPLIFAFLGSTIFEISRYANIKEKEKLATELKFLKSQVNPHFLFNALNNIYSLSVVNAPQTSESIMALSEILRYMVYDSNESMVPLKNEINYIKSLTELQLLKDSRGMNVELDLDHANSSLMVAPLMFIPFVENAFKHSKIENLKEGFIKIQLTTENKNISFHVLNSVPVNDFTKDQVGGVGLENTKKRLKLIYPDKKHSLKINQTDRQFEVDLKINCS